MNVTPLTLCLVCRENQVLLGMKKRGFGMGRWNGFGGKVNEGETIEDATKRELLEESGLTVSNMEKIGVVDFSWKGKEGKILEVNIFKATDFSGEPTETEEMKPSWFEVDAIPYDAMWPDDKYWIPLFLQNKKFTGKFIFSDNDVVLEYELKEVNEL